MSNIKTIIPEGVLPKDSIEIIWKPFNGGANETIVDIFVKKFPIPYNQLRDRNMSVEDLKKYMTDRLKSPEFISQFQYSEKYESDMCEFPWEECYKKMTGFDYYDMENEELQQTIAAEQKNINTATNYVEVIKPDDELDPSTTNENIEWSEDAWSKTKIGEVASNRAYNDEKSCRNLIKKEMKKRNMPIIRPTNARNKYNVNWVWLEAMRPGESRRRLIQKLNS